MEEQFIPYEQALALKGLGFNEPNLGSWMGYNISEPNLVLRGTMTGKNWDVICGAPLWQQAFDWFRNEHKLHSSFIADGYWETQQYHFRIDSKDKDFKITENTPNNSDHTIIESELNYEEARKACLNKLIEIIKTKQP